MKHLKGFVQQYQLKRQPHSNIRSGVKWSLNKCLFQTLDPAMRSVWQTAEACMDAIPCLEWCSPWSKHARRRSWERPMEVSICWRYPSVDLWSQGKPDCRWQHNRHDQNPSTAHMLSVIWPFRGFTQLLLLDNDALLSTVISWLHHLTFDLTGNSESHQKIQQG